MCLMLVFSLCFRFSVSSLREVVSTFSSDPAFAAQMSTRLQHIIALQDKLRHQCQMVAHSTARVNRKRASEFES